MIGRRRILEAGALAWLSAVVGCDDCTGGSGPPKPLGSVGPQSDTKKADVIVIGAGIAGLKAAHDLKKAGATVIVLEGRDRAGGRIWTDRSIGPTFDMGASWIHGSLGNPISAIAGDLNAKTIKSSYTDVTLYDAKGKRISDGEVESYLDEWAALEKEVEAVVEQASAPVSIGAGLKGAIAGESLSAEEQAALDWVVATQEVAAAEDLTNLSATFDDEGYPGGDKLFPDGYDQIIRHVGAGIDVRLSTNVTRIAHSDKGVEVTASTGTFKARYAIVTVPLGVLKKGKIIFAPALPKKKQRAIQRLAMGTLNKVALVFPKTFWPTERDFLGYMSPRKGEYPVFMNCKKFTDAHALIAFTGGSFARTIENQKDSDISARITEILRTMLGKKVVAPTKLKVARWTKDPFAYGSYSHVPPNASADDYKSLAEPVSNLLFAGEATTHKYPSTVHGAYFTGEREAERIAKG